MSAPAFSEAVHKMLREAGWFEGRAVETHAVEAAHLTRGLLLFPLAREFARSFAGLQFAAPGRAAWASFDGAAALSAQAPEGLSALEAWLGERFSVLGMLGARDKLLVMSERGAFYAAGEHVLVAYGTDVSALFERLHTLRRAQLRALN